MNDKVVSKELFMLRYCPNKYKAQEMCDKAVDFYLITLKFVPNWFVANKMPEKLGNSVFDNVDLFFNDVDANIIRFLSDDLGFNTIDLNNINFDIDNCDEDDPETINHVRLIT